MSSIILTTNNNELLINRKYFNPTGSVICYAGQITPDGWLLCDGTEVLKTEYSDLYEIIGNTYGVASDSNYFVLPNLKEKVPIGSSDVTNFNLGNTGGNKTVTLNVSQLPSHTHTGTSESSGTHNHSASDSGHTHTYADAYFAENLGHAGSNNYGTSAGTDYDNNLIYRSGVVTNTGYANITVNNNGSHSHTFTTDTTGSGNSVNIQNPYIVLNYLIKY
jgi:microcystin-dependent protein